MQTGRSDHIDQGINFATLRRHLESEFLTPLGSRKYHSHFKFDEQARSQNTLSRVVLRRDFDTAVQYQARPK